MSFTTVRLWAFVAFGVCFLISSTSSLTICRLSAGAGRFPYEMADLTPSGMFSHSTWKVSCQSLCAIVVDVEDAAVALGPKLVRGD